MKLRVTLEGKSYEVDVEILGEPQTPVVFPPPAPRKIKPPPPAVTFARGRRAAKSDDKTYRSPFAGMVVSVAVHAGQAVQKDETLLVLEAMKMETKVAAQIAGTVKSVQVEAGQAVKSGQVLVELE